MVYSAEAGHAGRDGADLALNPRGHGGSAGLNSVLADRTKRWNRRLSAGCVLRRADATSIRSVRATTSTGSTGRPGRSAARARTPRTSCRRPTRACSPGPRLLRNEDDLGYLLRALRNTFLNQKRTQSRRLRPGPLPDELDLVADPQARQPQAALEAGELYAAVAALPADFRDVLVAVDITGLSYKEAARALRIREGTVMSRLYRARQQVVRRIEGGRVSLISPCGPFRRAPSRPTRPGRRRPARA